MAEVGRVLNKLQNMLGGLLRPACVRSFYLAAFLFFATLTFSINSNLGVYADDDNAWFYSLTYKIYDAEGWNAQENALIDLMKTESRGENDQITRLIDKRDYTYNYILPEFLWSVPRPFVNYFMEGADYYKIYATNMWAGFGFAYLVTVGLFLLILKVGKASTQMLRALAWVSVIGLAGALLPSPKPPQFMLWNYWPHISSMLQQLVWFMQDPSFSFSAFSFTGRNNYILFMLGAFAVRWSGRYRLSYILLAFSFLFHASMAMLTILTLIFIDLALRPHIFRWKPLLAIIGIAIGYDLMIETLWNKVGWSALVALIPLVGVGVLLFKASDILKPYPVYASMLRSARRCARTHRAWSDVGLFVLGWALTAPLAIYLTKTAAGTQSTYFWSQLHIRILSVWQPAILLAICLQVFRSQVVAGYGRNLIALLACVLVALSCVSYLQSVKHLDVSFPINLMKTTSQVDGIASGKTTIAIEYPAMKRGCILPESLIWYLHIKDYALQEAHMQPYLEQGRQRGEKINCVDDVPSGKS